MPKNYQTLAADKKTQQWNKIPQAWRLPDETSHDANATNVMDIPRTCGLLNETECSITSDHDATALLGQLKAGVWTVEQVTVAFCKRAAIAQQLVSSVCSFDRLLKIYIKKERLANLRISVGWR